MIYETIAIILTIICVGVALAWHTKNWAKSITENADRVHKAIGLNITRLDGRLERLEGNLVGEIGRIESKLGGSIDRLEVRLSGNSDRLESKIALLAKDVSSLKAYVARNTTDIAWIKQKMGGPS